MPGPKAAQRSTGSKTGSTAGNPTRNTRSNPHFPENWYHSQAGMKQRRQRKAFNETYLSAKSNPAQASAWVSRANEDAGRPLGPQTAAREGSKAHRSQYSVEVDPCCRRQAASDERTDCCRRGISNGRSRRESAEPPSISSSCWHEDLPLELSRVLRVVWRRASWILAYDWA